MVSTEHYLRREGQDGYQMAEVLDLRFDLRPSKIDGTGCFAVKPFCRGDLIIEYSGEKINANEAERRLVRRVKRRICYIDQNLAIDGSAGGNESRFINHSCSPNCIVVLSKRKMLIYAFKDIVPGEEITVDYYFELQSGGTRCTCGESNCNGKAGRTGRFNFIFRRY